MDKAHSLISPSNFERRMLCPGSARIENGLPDVTSVHAARGIKLHSAVIKKITNDASWHENLAHDEKLAVTKSADYFNRLKNSPKAKIVLEIHEQKLPLDFLAAGMHGTVDSCLLIRRNRKYELHIIDYKFGAGIKVFAKNNKQLELYFLAVHNYLKKNKIISFRRLSVFMHISQPFLNNEYAWHMGDIEYDSLVKKKGRERKIIVNTIKNCYKKNAMRIPSSDACRFCKAALLCPELRAKVDY